MAAASTASSITRCVCLISVVHCAARQSRRMKRGSARGPLRKFKARLREVGARPEGGTAPALMAGIPKIARAPHRPRARRAGFSSPREGMAATRRAAGGARAQRLCAAEKRRVVGRACTRAHRDLTCRRLFERSERSERSEFGDRPTTRASQGSLAQRGQAVAQRLRAARRLARAIVQRDKADGRRSPQRAANGRCRQCKVHFSAFAKPVSCARCGA